MTLQEKHAALIAARQARVAAQSHETACATALFNQSDPNDESIKPGQVLADTDTRTAYVNVAGTGQVLELVGVVGGSPTPPVV